MFTFKKQKTTVQKRSTDSNGNIHFSFIDTLKINQQEEREDRIDAIITFAFFTILFVSIVYLEEKTGTPLSAMLPFNINN